MSEIDMVTRSPKGCFDCPDNGLLSVNDGWEVYRATEHTVDETIVYARTLVCTKHVIERIQQDKLGVLVPLRLSHLATVNWIER